MRNEDNNLHPLPGYGCFLNDEAEFPGVGWLLAYAKLITHAAEVLRAMVLSTAMSRTSSALARDAGPQPSASWRRLLCDGHQDNGAEGNRGNPNE
jgi:hypothetical protein